MSTIGLQKKSVKVLKTSPSFSNQIKSFVNLLFEVSGDVERFKLTLRDFLISLKEFSAGEDDNAELYVADKEAEQEQKARAEKEAAMRVPGLLKPDQLDEDAEL